MHFHTAPPAHTCSLQQQPISGYQSCAPRTAHDAAQSLPAPQHQLCTLTAPVPATSASAPKEKSHLSHKYTTRHPHQFAGCRQDGWICACPGCAVRALSVLHVQNSFLLHLKVPEKIKQSHAFSLQTKFQEGTLRTKPTEPETHPKYRRS